MRRSRFSVACFMAVALCLGIVQTGHSVNLCTIISPKRFEKSYSFPIRIVVQLDQAARRDTFQASLNGKDITAQFREIQGGVRAFVGPEDGLEIEEKTDPERKMNILMNILKISVQGAQTGEEMDLETFFFVSVDKLVTVGPEGGTIQSFDGNLVVNIPRQALSAATIIAVTKTHDSRGMGAVYQLAPESICLAQPVTIVMKYDPEDLPPGVVEDDLFTVTGKRFPKKLDHLFVDKKAHIVTGTSVAFSKVFLSYYVPIGRALTDIPPATEWRLPIGDCSDASYTCGQDYASPAKSDVGENLTLLHRWGHLDFDHPRIVLKGDGTLDQWRAVAAFNQSLQDASLLEPDADDASPCNEDKRIFNEGEDWVLLSKENQREGFPVHAIADGLIIHSENGGGYAHTVVLAHQPPSGTIVSVYSGLYEKSPCPVGTVVHRGNVIGKLSDAGTRGDCFHYAIGKESLIRIDSETGAIKVPATWVRAWRENAVYDKYYDPTNFLLNIMGKYYWEFNVDGNDEGWIVNQAEGKGGGFAHEVRDGVFSFAAPPDSLEVTSYPLNVETDSADSVFFRMKGTSQDGYGTVFFATDEEPQYSEDKTVQFQILSEDEFQEYRVFMADNVKWKGRIVGIRMDLRDSMTTGTGRADFDYIRLGRASLSWPPDTGQSKCYDNSQEIPCPASQSPFFGQDGCYAINTPNQEVKTINGEEIVMDHVTGLIWQRRDDGIERTWREGVEYCENLTLAGYSDWRIPTKKELESILNYGRFRPTLDTAKFPYPNGADACYWSGTTRAFLSLSAWKVCLWDSEASMPIKEDRNYVRAVRGRPLEFGLFGNNGDGTVTDMTTGLMWQQTETKAMAWAEALAYCENLDLAGYHDWRLPSIRELATLADDNRKEPAIDTAYFPACRPAIYWSSTSYAAYPSFAWYVTFNDGMIQGSGYKERNYYVRAVRSGK